MGSVPSLSLNPGPQTLSSESNYSKELSTNSRKIEIQAELYKQNRGFAKNVYKSIYSADRAEKIDEDKIYTLKSDPAGIGNTQKQVSEDNDNNVNILRERLEIPNLWKVFRGSQIGVRIVWTVVFLFSLSLFIYETVDRIEKLIDTPKSASVKLAVSLEALLTN
jgi:hypothetical protein